MGYILDGGLIVTVDNEDRAYKDSAIVILDDRITEIGDSN